MMDLFSERSAEELFAASLEWRRLARAEQCDDGTVLPSARSRCTPPSTPTFVS